MTSNFGYVNPWGNKYIHGNVYTEKGIAHTFKLILPYKTFGWYINDIQGNDISNAINKNYGKRNSIVSNAKSDIKKNVINYTNLKRSLEAATKGKDAMEKLAEESKNKLTELKGQIDGLRATAGTKQKAVDTKKNELILAEAKLNDLLKKEMALASEKTAIEDSKNSLSKGESDIATIKASLTKVVNDTKKVLDNLYAKLLKNAPQRKAEISASKIALYASKKEEYQSNLDKIYS